MTERSEPFGSSAAACGRHGRLGQGGSASSTPARAAGIPLVAGGTSKEIGRTLDISPRTVEIYRAKLMAKTQAGTLQELVRWAVLAGLA